MSVAPPRESSITPCRVPLLSFLVLPTRVGVFAKQNHAWPYCAVTVHVTQVVVLETRRIRAFQRDVRVQLSVLSFHH